MSKRFLFISRWSICVCVIGCLVSVLTGGGCLADEGDQVVLDLCERVKVVHHKHVPLAGLAADVPELRLVNVGHPDHKHTVAYTHTESTRTHREHKAYC